MKGFRMFMFFISVILTGVVSCTLFVGLMDEKVSKMLWFYVLLILLYLIGSSIAIGSSIKSEE